MFTDVKKKKKKLGSVSVIPNFSIKNVVLHL